MSLGEVKRHKRELSALEVRELDLKRRKIPRVLCAATANTNEGRGVRPRADPLAEVSQPGPSPQAANGRQKGEHAKVEHLARRPAVHLGQEGALGHKELGRPAPQ
eukprot:7011098-Alexandrium_andersonii.AAC.1